MKRFTVWMVWGWMSCVMAGVGAGTAWAQAAPASTAPDDTPSIHIGATLFADYTYTTSPEITDADGNIVHASAFNVGRSYINVTGNVSHIVAFRLTPDIARETGAGTSLNGSLTFRVKYAFAQVNLDDWLPPGAWARVGIQQTPWVDFEEGIYRYRFQGTVFSEREGFLSSSDAGASFRYALPSNYGDVHVGVYNGETYSHQEANNRKAFQVRGSVRPFARSSVTLLRGLRAHAFVDADSYVKDGDRKRTIGSVTFEHRFVNAGFEYLRTSDRPSVAVVGADGRGYSVWATPRMSNGWEALLRRDHMTPDLALGNQVRDRTIAGIAYWLPHQGNVSSALLLDYDGQTFQNLPSMPKQQRLAVHALVNF